MMEDSNTMDNSMQRKGGVFLSYVSIIINTLIQLLYTPFLLRMLGQSEYGLYSLVASIISYLTVLDLGFGNALIVYTSKYRAEGKVKEEKKLHGMFKIVFLIIGLLATILGIILYFNVELFFGSSMTSSEITKMKIMMLILSFNLMISFSFNIYSSIISAYEKFVFQKIIAIGSAFLKPLIMIPLLLLGYKSIAMTLVITITNILVVLSNYFFCKNRLNIKIKYSGFDKKLFKTIFGYSIWIFIGAIVAVSGTLAVSIYSIAATLNQMFISLSTAISGVLLPKMSSLVAKKASSRVLTDEMIKVGRLQNYIIFLMCSGLILFGKDFIIIWAGDSYSESYYVSLLLIIPICIPLIQNLGLSILQAMNKFRFKSISSAIMSIINLLISVFLAKKWGATGAALGTCISLVICNIIIMNIYYYKIIKIDIYSFWKSIIKQTIPFMIPIVAALALKTFINFGFIMSFILNCSIYILLFCIISYMFSMNDYEKNIILNIISKLGIKKVKYERNSKV